MPEVEINQTNSAARGLNLFEPLDFFMMRAPILNIEFFKELFDVNQYYQNQQQAKENIIALSQKELFKDIIGTTSPSLQYALERFETDTDPGKRKIINQSFTKYLIRMSTRPTPFGLLAGLSAGKLGNNTGIKLNSIDSHLKRARPDMEWLMGVINSLEKRVEVVEQLKVHANTSIFFSGNRVEIPYITHYGQQKLDDKSEGISIRATKAVIDTLKQAESPVLYAELLDGLITRYPETSKIKIKDFLWQLFQNEFLISELRPPLMVSSPFDYLVEKLSGINGLASELSELMAINDLIRQYNGTKPGEGVAIFKSLSGKMDQVYTVKHSTQVDLKLNTVELVLNRSIADELAKAAECLWRLSPEYANTFELRRYRMEFIERYGTCREVPVLELLDNDRGLGAPPGYFYPKGRMEILENPASLSVRKFENFLRNELLRVVKDRDSEIEITEELLEKLEPVKPDPKLAPLSLELYFSIAALSQAAIDNGDFEIILAPNLASAGAGKTFGRFIDLLEPEFREALHRIEKLEKERLKDCVLAEIVYLPDKGRNANVTISENIRDYEIVIGANSSKPDAKTLPLSDILVGADRDRFYLKSQSLQKRVLITTGHMLNTRGVPNVYRFLREVSGDGIRNLSWIDFGCFSNSPFLPQIRYGKVILSPAKWVLSLNVLRVKKEALKKDFYELINNWRTEWNVPRVVKLTEYDNRNLLDLEHPLHLEVLQDELLHKDDNGIFEIVAMGENLDKVWVKGESGTYITEFVLPFIRNKEAVLSAEKDGPVKNDNHDTSPAALIKDKIPDSFRIRYPGSEWLYLKLYGNSNREDELLAFDLNNFWKKISNDGLATSFFFIRYQDNEPHIRLRFRGEPEQLSARLMPCLNQWFLFLAESGLLSKIVIDTYEREVERYGGPELIETAEELFYYDSLAAINLLFLKRAGTLKIGFDTVAVISILDLIENLGLVMDEELDWLNSVVSAKDYLDEFRQTRRLLMELGDSSNNWEALRNHEGGSDIFNILAARQKAVARFTAKLKTPAVVSKLTNTKSGIIESIVHLHCNRLLGINRDYEKKIMTLARHTISSLLLYQRERNKSLKNKERF